MPLEPENLWVELVGGVRIGAVAMHPGEPVLGEGAVDRAAATLVDVFAPVVEAIRSMAPFGRAGMWGTLADHLAAHAVGHDRRLGRDGTRGWTIGADLIERVSVRQPWLRGRPNRLDVNGVVLV